MASGLGAAREMFGPSFQPSESLKALVFFGDGSGTRLVSPGNTLGGTMSALLTRINDRTARVGVIGQGYVGLPLALVLCEGGFPVTGFDLDPVKVAAIGRGES